jgi:hypothetical protein
MQVLLVFVVLMFSAALILYASPVILFLVPLVVVGLIFSALTDTARHHSKSVR